MLILLYTINFQCFNFRKRKLLICSIMKFILFCCVFFLLWGWFDCRLPCNLTAGIFPSGFESHWRGITCDKVVLFFIAKVYANLSFAILILWLFMIVCDHSKGIYPEKELGKKNPWMNIIHSHLTDKIHIQQKQALLWNDVNHVCRIGQASQTCNYKRMNQM